MRYIADEGSLEYFDWLCDKVTDRGRYAYDRFSHLLEDLHLMHFRAVYPLDDARESAIDDMREDFIDSTRRTFGLSDLPYDYTVLELLVELAERIEDKVMDNPRYGGRTKKWFWIMLENLGLDEMDNFVYDREYVEETITRWLRHDFEPNGDGSPFPIKHPPTDARDVDIWRLANWYLSERFEGRW